MRYFSCPDCHESLPSIDVLVNHLHIHNDEKDFDCLRCLTSFKSSNLLRSHLCSGNINCQFCDVVSKNNTEFKKHMSVAHTELLITDFGVKVLIDRFRCYNCDEIFSDTHTCLNNDKRDELGEKYTRFLQCVICLKTFDSKESFDSHVHYGKRNDDNIVVVKERLNKESGEHKLVKAEKKLHLVVNRKKNRFQTPSKVKSLYKCYYPCMKTFPTHTEWRIHKLSCKKGYTCTLCSKEFKTVTGRIHHQLMVHRDGYKCEECGKSYKHELYYHEHMTTHTGEQPYHCTMCDRRFGHEVIYESHLQKHTVRKTQVCKLCDKAYKFPAELRRHMMLHTGDKKYHCVVCDKGFCRQYELQAHYVVHTGDKPYECETCHVRFSHEAARHRHMKFAHTGLRPYTCPVCGKGMYDKTHYDVHMSKHTGIKNFQCPICSKKFSSKAYVKQHQKVCRGKAFNYQGRPHKHQTLSCPVCNKKFRFKSLLKVHVKSHLICDCLICKVKFASQHQLDDHMVTYHKSLSQYSCEKCEEKFSYHVDLINHMNYGECDPADINVDEENYSPIMEEVVLNEVDDELDGIGEIYEDKIMVLDSKDDDLILEFLNDPVDNTNKENISMTSSSKMLCPEENTKKSIVLEEGRNKMSLFFEGVGGQHIEIEQDAIMDIIYGNTKQPDESPTRINVKVEENGVLDTSKDIATFNFPIKQEKMGNELPSDIDLPPETVLQCVTCMGTFESEDGFLSHECVQEKMCKCFPCNETYSSLYDLLQHLESEHTAVGDTGLFQCALCPSVRSVPTVEMIKKHMSLHARDGEYRCLICGIGFDRKDLYDKHILIHTTSKTFECDMCFRSYTRIGALETHIRQNHSNTRSFSCNMCTQSFPSVQLLKKHYHSHTGLDELQCSMCNETFEEYSDLCNHMNAHPKDKQHSCAKCGKMFRVLNNMREHFKFCEQILELDEHLPGHRVHKDIEQKHECLECGNYYATANSLKLHMRYHTGEKLLSCKVCKKKFLAESTLKDHMVVHTRERNHECKFCFKKFGTMPTLKMHTNTIHLNIKPFVCEVCDSAFASKMKLKMHVNTHTGEKPFICDMCGAAYAQSANLSSHKKRHHPREQTEVVYFVDM